MIQDGTCTLCLVSALLSSCTFDFHLRHLNGGFAVLSTVALAKAEASANAGLISRRHLRRSSDTSHAVLYLKIQANE